MKVHVSNSNFEAGSYSKRCQSFFDEQDRWHTADGMYLQDKDLPHSVTVREQTKPTEEYLLRVQQYGYEIAVDAPIRHIRHALFRVATLSMSETVTDMNELRRWYVIKPEGQPEHVAYFKNLTPIDSEVDKEEFRQDMRFVLHNGLYTPNREELYDLLNVLDS